MTVGDREEQNISKELSNAGVLGEGTGTEFTYPGEQVRPQQRYSRL